MFSLLCYSTATSGWKCSNAVIFAPFNMNSCCQVDNYKENYICEALEFKSEKLSNKAFGNCGLMLFLLNFDNIKNSYLF